MASDALWRTVDGEAWAPEPAAVGSDNAVALAIDPGEKWVSSCVVIVDPRADVDAAAARLTLALEVKGGPVAAFHTFSSPTNPVTTNRDAVTRWMPYLVTLLGAAAGVATMLTRSSEWAVYRLSGMSRRTLISLLVLEQAYPALLFAAGAALTTFVIASQLISPSVVILSAAAASCLWLALSSIGAIIIASRSPLTMARD